MQSARVRTVLVGFMGLGLVLTGCTKKAAPSAPAAASIATPTPPPPSKTYTIAWSVWTGWMPFKLMETKGLLAKRAQEQGVKVALKEFKGYMDSVQAFAAK